MAELARRFGVKPAVAISAAKKALAGLGFDLADNTRPGVLQAKSGFSLRSWGEEVTVSITEEPGGASVRVSSEPAVQLLDWGKSAENVEAILAAIEKDLARQ